MAKTGRPRIQIDWSKVDALCQIQCTGPEIAAVLGVAENTLTVACKRDHGVTFCEYIKEKSAGGKASLRRKQWKLADKSAAMAIFLGKNILGQSDQPAEPEREGDMKALLDMAAKEARESV